MKAFLALSISALILSSCSSIKVTTDYDRTVDFSAYKTYDFLEIAANTTINELNQRRIISAIENNLNSKGLTKSDNPDLHINIYGIVEQKQDVSATTDYWGGYGRHWGYYGYGSTWSTTTVNVYDYEVGTLIIDMVDNKKDILIWEGTGSKTLGSTTNPEQVEANINEAVNKILEKFPPGVK